MYRIARSQLCACSQMSHSFALKWHVISLIVVCGFALKWRVISLKWHVICVKVACDSNFHLRHSNFHRSGMAAACHSNFHRSGMAAASTAACQSNFHRSGMAAACHSNFHRSGMAAASANLVSCSLRADVFVANWFQQKFRVAAGGTMADIRCIKTHLGACRSHAVCMFPDLHRSRLVSHVPFRSITLKHHVSIERPARYVFLEYLLVTRLVERLSRCVFKVNLPV